MSELSKIARMRKGYYEAKRGKTLTSNQANEAYAVKAIRKREWVRDMSEHDLSEEAAEGGISKDEYLREMKRRGKTVL